MGLLGFLSGKKEVTSSVKNELNKLVEHWGKDIDKLNTTDSVSTYISTLEDALLTAKKLETLENTYDWKHGKYKWNGGVQKTLESMNSKKSQNERNFIDRAYERLKRDSFKVSTEASKAKKRAQFFAELEHYYEYFNDDTVEYIKSLQ